MKLILIGPPGAGKGTQSQHIKNYFNIPHISTGDMLRQHIQNNTTLGKEVQHTIERGDLVSDDIIIEMIKERIQKADCVNGFLLDGFPRTMQQAQALVDANISIDAIIQLEVHDNDVIQRLSGRWIHPASGRVYHTSHCPPQIAYCDDVTKEPLIQRDDDKAENIKNRLRVYHAQTTEVITFYNALTINNPILLHINGMQKPEKVFAEIQQHLVTQIVSPPLLYAFSQQAPITHSSNTSATCLFKPKL